MSQQDWLAKDFYKTLGVSKDASASDIKKAYRALARKLHPDANPGNKKNEERFKEVSEAYDTLSDDKRRKEYDEQRALFGNGGGFRFPGSGGGGGSGGRGGGFGDLNIDDLLGKMGGGGSGGLGDVLGGIFNRGGNRSGRAARRGADVESDVTLSFAESLDGVTVPLRLTSEGACDTCHGTGAKAGTLPRVCAACEGTGHTSRNAGGFAFAEPCRECKGRGMVVDNPCPTCKGSGRGASSRTVQARIPAGVKDSQRIRLKGKGAPGEQGGPNGDLYVAVHVTPHPVFGRKDDHLTVTVPVTFPEAVLGADVKVPTIGGGTVTVKVPPGTSNGRVLRVRGRGATQRDGTKGDLMVTIEVAVPANLSAPARQALEAYRDATTDHDPRADLLAATARPGTG